MNHINTIVVIELYQLITKSFKNILKVINQTEVFLICIRLKTIKSTQSVKAKFHYVICFEAGSKLVADLQRAEIWPIT